MRRSVAFILKGYPRLSETFIAQEILELERRGIVIQIFSLRQPTDRVTHPVHDDISAQTNYLPEYIHGELLRVLRAWWRVRRMSGYRQAKRQWLKDLRRDFTRNRVRRFCQALVLACEVPAEVCHLHAHFLHTPASVTRYASFITGLPWSASAHAKDIWTSPDWDLTEKLGDCQWAVTCTASNREHLQRLAPKPDTVELVYHGLDLERFSEPEGRTVVESSPQTVAPCRILSVGRAVSKKGYECLLRALARLPGGVDWCFVHVGGGELLEGLKTLAMELGIAARITWLGPRSQGEVLAEYAKADIFVLASRIAADGDRDGLPNVLMEAQSQAVACVATTVSAIPELIEHEVTGLLVAPDDDVSLGAALNRLLTDVRLRQHLAAAGNRRVRSEFALSETITRLAKRFHEVVNAQPTG